MVFNAITVILNGQWIFSVWLCDMYNAMDVVFSTASILNLFCISMYRLVLEPEKIREEIDPINSSWLETNEANLESQMGSLIDFT